MTEYEIRKMIRKLSRRRHTIMKMALSHQANDLNSLVRGNMNEMRELSIEIEQLWDRLEK